MKRLALIFTVVLFAFSQVLMAQPVEVRGTVANVEDGTPVPGASIIVKGTTIGTTTDVDGNFALTVPEDATALIISFVGLKTQEIPIDGRETIDVVLEPDILGLDEVVVTALGVRRSEKRLGYAASRVSGEEVSQSRTHSALNTLQGKIAGVNISTASGAPGASTKVVIRGYSSIGGNNQPLFVVDGVPLNNSAATFYDGGGANDVVRTQDFGNRANDVNPDDIESITVLKGASATALYGSRAANGVVMITTKQGEPSTRIKTTYTGGYSFSRPLRLPQLQGTFGQGWSGHHALDENGSWGPVMDGKERLWGYVVDNQQQLKPFEHQEMNMWDFYDVGTSMNHSLALSGGRENATFRLSYSNVSEDGIVPTDADSYQRNTFGLSGTAKADRLTSSASFNYVNKKSRYVASGQGDGGGAGPAMYQELIQIPRDLSIVDFKDYENKFNNVNNFYTPYADNPYRVLHENQNRYAEDRFYGHLNLDYRIMDWLSAKLRGGADVANTDYKDWGAIAIADPGSNNALHGRNDVPGRVDEWKKLAREFNVDFILSGTKEFSGDFGLDVLAGLNVNERYFKTNHAYITELVLPYYYDLSNTAGSKEAEATVSKRRLMGVYGQADLTFWNYLFLTLTARNDWSSTLPLDNNSFFYPGANLSIVLTDAVPAIQSNIISFAKLRASAGQTGNDASPYSIRSVMIPSQVYLPFGNINFPVGGVSGFEVSNRIGNPTLQPEITTEYEFGGDFRFFMGRVGIDVAYYNRTTTDQILVVPLAPSTGYTSQVLNFGKVENKGVELLVNGTLIQSGDLQWDLSLNYANNRNKVLELREGLTKVTLQTAYEVEYVTKVGKPLGVYEVPQVAKDPQGRTIVNEQGIPTLDPEKKEIGTYEPKYLAGLTTRLSWKGLSLSGAVDVRQGGLIYSYTSQLTNFVGNSTESTYNMRQPFLEPNSVKQIDNGDGTFSYVENNTPIEMGTINTYYNRNTNNSRFENSVFDRSYVKLREVILSYRFPSFSATVPIETLEVSLIGRNLLLWTPEENNFIDPEVTTWGNDLDSEFGEFAGGPTVRSVGASLKVIF